MWMTRWTDDNGDNDNYTAGGSSCVEPHIGKSNSLSLSILYTTNYYLQVIYVTMARYHQTRNDQMRNVDDNSVDDDYYTTASFTFFFFFQFILLISITR